MLTTETIQQIHVIWDRFIATDKRVYNNRGEEYDNINALRLETMQQLILFIRQFLENTIDIYEFRTNVDSFNKRNNLWGFTAIKGQMYFNQLVKYNEQQINKLTELLRSCIAEPSDLPDALNKIDQLELFCQNAYQKAQDKRKTANPSSAGYFLSYFWQIQNPDDWPILYTSQIRAYQELEIWEEKPTQKESYRFFYHLNEEIKKELEKYTQSIISNWDIEHAFWEYKRNTEKAEKPERSEIKDRVQTEETLVEDNQLTIKTSFELSDYLIPKVAKLIELGSQTNISSSAKGNEYEKLVAEIFKQLDFEVESLGQGTGRNPDAIIRCREENTAFIVDAKAYTNGYTLGTDDRAIKEYIAHYCPQLNKEGYKKVGFIVVSNTFKSNFDSFINTITWNTEIKRFILLTSGALLYLLAYKTKNRLSLSTIIESLIGLGNLIEAKDIIAEFDDV